MLDNYDAVKEFAKKIFKAVETEPIIGKVEFFSGPVRDIDKIKTVFVIFPLAEVRDRVQQFRILTKKVKNKDWGRVSVHRDQISIGS